MTKNKKQMLNKLLERSHNKIIIDRVLVQSKNKFENKKLVTESDDIKKEVVKHFKEQFRKRNHQFEIIDQEWANIYKEQKEINENWYIEVMSKISEEEWIEITNSLKEDTVPGISGISYQLIKKVSPKTREYFVEFANKVICEGKFLKK